MKPVRRSGKFISTGQAELLFQLAGGHGGNGVLRKNQIEIVAAPGGRHHSFEEKRIGQIFEIAQLGVAAHLPGREQVAVDAEFPFHRGRPGDLGSKHVHRMAPADHFLRPDRPPQPNRRPKGDKTVRASETRCGAGRWHPKTLGILGRRFNSFYRREMGLTWRREKYKLRLRLVDGVIAQLVERLNGIQEVRSSSLLGSTSLRSERSGEAQGCRAGVNEGGSARHEGGRNRSRRLCARSQHPANPSPEFSTKA